METCVRTVCLCLCVCMCVHGQPAMQTDVCIKSGIYVKVLIFSSHFLLMFEITVSRQEFLNSGERERERWGSGVQEEKKNRNWSFLHGAA